MKRPLRVVLATPLCDGHDVAICAVTRMLRELGVEAVYIGFNRTPLQIVKAAVEEDADAIAISSYNGGHESFLRETVRQAERRGIGGIPLFCGGGGTILESDVSRLERLGVTRVYRPPLELREACADLVRVTTRLRSRRGRKAAAAPVRVALARRISAARSRAPTPPPRRPRERSAVPDRPRVWGFGGRGGAGKSTLIDEFLYRFLARTKERTVAVLCVDPTLADRVRMLHCYAERVFLRSIALGPGDSVERKVSPLIARLRRERFALILVESVGLGQNDLGVAPYVDASVCCMTPDYGTDLQLEKEALLGRSAIVVMNKGDHPQAESKARRVRRQLREGQTLHVTQANRHHDPGTTALFLDLCARAGLDLAVPSPHDASGEHAAPRALPVPSSRRGYLGEIVDRHEEYYAEMEREVRAARESPRGGDAYRARFMELWERFGFDGANDLGARNGDLTDDGKVLWRTAGGRERLPVARRTTCGICVPVLGMPPRDAGPGEIVRYLYKQNVPGEFPFTEGAYTHRRADESPIRMFAGLGLPETTNARFHLLARRGGAPRLSTAFDSLTLYGLDSDEPGAIAKVGEGGVAVDTIDDVLRLYDGFDLEKTSVSMTINGPAPTVLALYLAAARRRGADWKELRGTTQTDILKEIQAQNECLFPLEASLRAIADMTAFTTRYVPRWYPLSISGYHIGEAGANPIQELAFTLANALTYVEVFRHRGLAPEEFTRRFSFFFTAGSELEFKVLGRVARRVWSIAMRRTYGVEGPGLRLRFHSQTSGKSLQDVDSLHNLARVTLQAENALENNTNSLHTNSYKETYSTPQEDDVTLAIGCQQIPLLEGGEFRFIENLAQGGWGLSYLEDAVEKEVHRIFREIDRQGGVIAAIENEFFRSEIQDEVQAERRARESGEKLIVGVNYLRSAESSHPRGGIVRISMRDKRKQAARTREFKRRHRKKAAVALSHLRDVAAGDGNVFAALVEAVEVATVGQITHALWDVWGRFRPSM